MSISIVNQLKALHRYVDTTDELAGAEVLEFVDNGYTGTNFERLAMQELLEMVRQSQVNCIIVKDYCAIIGLNQKDLENQGFPA